MAVTGVVVVDSVLVHTKVHICTIWLLEGEYYIIFTILIHLELVLRVIQCHNIGDDLFVKPHLTIPFHIIFMCGLDDTTISINCHKLNGLHTFETSFLLQNRSNDD